MAQSIGVIIKTKRLALGLTQEDLAIKLGLTQANISRIEANTRGPSAVMLIAIAKALGCDVRELLGLEKESRASPQLDEDAKTFVLKVIKGDPQLGMYLRSFAKNSNILTDNDWKFLAITLKMAMEYAAEVLGIKKSKKSF